MPVSNGVLSCGEHHPVDVVMLSDLLEKTFQSKPDAIALVDAQSGHELTFGALLKTSKSIAALFQKKGLKPQDFVVFTAKNSLKSCCTLLGLIFCQVTFISPKYSYTAFEFQALLKDLDLKLAIGDSISAPKLKQVKAKNNQSVPVFNIDEEEIWTSAKPEEFVRNPPLDPKSATLMMIFTSGSTGPSKAVCVSHHNVLANSVQFTFPMHRAFLNCPITHLSGILFFLLPLFRGETVFLVAETLRDNISEFCQLIHKYQVCTLLAMPVLLNRLIDAAGEVAPYLKSVQNICTGGSVVSQAAIDKFHSCYPHIELENTYGSSESTGLVLAKTGWTDFNALKLVRNVEAKILDLKTNAILGPNQPGQLAVKTPSVAMRYYNNPTATEETFIDGWLMTGDLAYYDEEENFYIVDRVKQMIKCLDSQVAPGDLESILEAHDEVSKVLVAGLPHEKFGEAPAAFVVPSRNVVDLNALRTKLKQDIELKCAYFKHLHGGLYFVARIPETESGKFSRRDVVEQFSKNQLEILE